MKIRKNLRALLRHLHLLHGKIARQELRLRAIEQRNHVTARAVAYASRKYSKG